MNFDLEMKKITAIHPIANDFADDIFITCASFEERFLRVPDIFQDPLPKNIVLFKFHEPLEEREINIKKFKEKFCILSRNINFYPITVEHGKDVNAIIQLHSILKETGLLKKRINVSIDISTFTKNLLINIICYINDNLNTEKFRCLYTIPGRYASPQEGWLSASIKSIQIPPLFWHSWSPLKDNLLVTILGFEEMRAWSLIDNFSADANWIFVSKPGSKKEWDSFCEEYNKKLLSIYKPCGSIPALDISKISTILSNTITRETTEKYNVFISPLGTKPQIIGVLLYAFNSNEPLNIVTTNVIQHNIPYYSWDTGDSYEFYFPTPRRDNAKDNKI